MTERQRLEVSPLAIGPIADGEDVPDPMQTGENVIRLTDMNRTRTARPRNRSEPCAPLGTTRLAFEDDLTDVTE